MSCFRPSAIPVIFLGLLLNLAPGSYAQQPDRIQPERITIARDSFGVAHVFAPTNPEMAYGLAWAFAEDQFLEMQEGLIFATGRMGAYQGPKGAPLDYFVQWIRAYEQAQVAYPEALPPDIRQMLDAYVAAVNRYAATHPDEVVYSPLFPITPQDALAGLITILTGMVGAPDAVKFILEGKPDEFQIEPALMSNAFAVHPSRSTDGRTRLVINPHMAYGGAFTMYEAHIQSDEGVNILGGFMPGLLSPGMGVNPHLGWAMTFNWPDFVDIYEIERHPRNKNLYRYDDRWVPFDIRKARLRIKLGFFPVTLKKKTYWTAYGPAIKGKDGRMYAIRYPHDNLVNALTEWFRLAQARNLAEFRQALDLQAIPMFNIVYADQEENIAWFFNGQVPDRRPGYDWQRVLPGNTARTRWTDYYDFEELPQLINPECGYVYNCNNSPFHATCPEHNLKPEDFPPQAGYTLNRENNRDHRLRELFAEKGKLSAEEVREIKYDITYPPSGPVRNGTFQIINDIDPKDYPDIADALAHMKQWDFRGNIDNRHAALALVAFNLLFLEKEYGFVEIELGTEVETGEMVEAIRKAQKLMLKRYGRLDVPLGEVQQMIRGEHRLGVAGLPETLTPVYTVPSRETPLRALGGDTFVAFASWYQGRLESLETIMPYGASSKPDSPHFFDQAPLFVNHQTKTMTLDKQSILQNAKRTYHPQ